MGSLHFHCSGEAKNRTWGKMAFLPPLFFESLLVGGPCEEEEEEEDGFGGIITGS